MGTIQEKLVTLYTTSDGQEFIDKNKAIAHENKYVFCEDYHNHSFYVDGILVDVDDLINWAQNNTSTFILLSKVVL